MCNRLSDGRPIPPPKPTQLQGKSWPPPAPTDSSGNALLESESGFKTSPNVLNGQSIPPYHSRSYPTSPNKPPPPPKRKDPSYYKKSYQENSEAEIIDRPSMGHSYSQENVYSPSRAYSNVMFRNQRQVQCSPPQSPSLPPPVGLDLSSRENRGSAFELYRKIDPLSEQDTIHANQR